MEDKMPTPPGMPEFPAIKAAVQNDAVRQAIDKLVDRMLDGAPPSLVEDVKRGLGLDPPEAKRDNKFKVGDRVGIVRESDRRRSMVASPTIVGVYGKLTHIGGCMSGCHIPRAEGGGECRVYYIEPLGGLTDEAREYYLRNEDDIRCSITEIEHID